MKSHRPTATGRRASGPLQQLRSLGQVVWLEYLRRDLLLQGALRTVIDRDGVRGVCSTPTTFAQAIAWTGQYDVALAEAVRRGEHDGKELYERLALADIEVAADQLRDVYERSDRRDGYVTLAVPPPLHDDAAAIVAEARRLWARVGRPNLMLTLYATPAGLVALPELVAAGINTILAGVCGPRQHEAAMEAYFTGLERRDGDLAGLAGVAGLAVAPLDRVIDDALALRDAPAARGQAGIAVARRAYREWKRQHAGPRWTRLAARGARPQRLLFGTFTGASGREETRYAEQLIGADTIVALPVSILDDLRARERVEPTLDADPSADEAHLAALGRHGIDLEAAAVLALDGELSRLGADYATLIAAVERRRTEVVDGLPPLNPSRRDG